MSDENQHPLTLVSWLFEHGFYLAGCAGTFFLGGHRYRLIELKKEIQSVIECIDDVAERASSYWLEAPAPTDAVKEAQIERKLHQISVEILRVHKEYKICERSRLIKYNDKMLEIITLQMSQTRTPSRQKARNIGRLANHYIAYLKVQLSTKLKWAGFLTSFSKESD